MGIKDWCKNKYNKVKEFYYEGKEAVKQVWNNLRSSKTSSPEVDIAPPERGGHTSPGGDIDVLRRHNRIIAKYQKEVSQKAKREETAVSEAYDKAYESLIVKLREQSINTAPIEKYIKGQKVRFSHLLRDEVNERVNPSCEEWEDLMNDEYSTKSDIQEYTDSVYQDAQHLLYDTLAVVVKDTAKFIEDFVNKYLSDRKKILENKRQSLVNMTSDEETRNKEIQKLFEEYATLLFIINSIETKVRKDD